MLSIFSRLFRSKPQTYRHPKRSIQPAKKARLLVEQLEDRLTPATLTTLVFNIPTEVANQGVSLGLYSNQDTNYLAYTTPLTPNLNNLTIQGFSNLPAHATALPLLDLTPNAGTYTAPVSVNVVIPDGTDLESGEMFIFVGAVQTGLAYNASTVAAPSAAPSPGTATIVDNFAQVEFNYQTSGSGAGLDIDISAVDSTGFPLAIVYPPGTVGFPTGVLGITQGQTDLVTNYENLFAPGSQAPAAAAPEFLQSATFPQVQVPDGGQLVAPKDILSQEVNPPTMNTATAVAAPSSLAAGADYYYLVTAYSDNVIANSVSAANPLGVVGETLPSNVVNVQNLAAGNAVQLSWTQYFSPSTAGYNIYRYSSTAGAAPTADTTYNLIAQLAGATTTSYVDSGAVPQAQQITPSTASNYGFNPLSEYYTEALRTFFEYYETNTFSLTRDSVQWLGKTVSYTPTADWNATGATYTVLQLTAQNSSGSATAGDVLNIYLPFFATNTRFVLVDGAAPPPMPSWMTDPSGQNASPYETPAQMVLGCDGVFKSIDPDAGTNAKVLVDIENSIVSAFNRGLAVNFNPLPPNNLPLQPDNWASAPAMSNPAVVAADAGSTLAADTYYYAVTALNVFGETTPSLVLGAVVAGGESVTLNWTTNPPSGGNAPPAIKYNIYRGTHPDQLFFLTSTTNLSHKDQGGATGAGQPPVSYFAAGTTSNWYAQYVQTNSLVDPVHGVSINGLSYGYAYSDQGGFSTNAFFALTDVPGTITINLGAQDGPGFITQSLPNAVVNQAYEATILASGDDTTYALGAGSALPAGLSFNAGAISGTPTALGSSSFVVVATNNGKTTSMVFNLDVTTAPPGPGTQPFAITGVANGGTLILPDAIGPTYAATIQATGGTGPYTLTLVNALPGGMSLGFTTDQADGTMTSDGNGVFTLSGTAGTGGGFQVTAKDSHPTTPHTITFTISISVAPALAITTTTLPDPVHHQPYAQVIATNNTTPNTTTFARTSGTLPAGLTLTPWGVLQGTPTAAGSATFEVTATSIAGAVSPPQSYTVNVGATYTALAFSTTSLPPVLPGAAYNETIAVTGGSGAVTFAIVNGALPDGLSLDAATGAITGTAPNSGGSSFTVRAMDALGNSAFQGYTIGVLTITENTHNLAANATTLVIQGTGFDPIAANNAVALPGSGATAITVTNATATTLTITFTGPLTAGPLNARVTVDGVTSAQQQVATVGAVLTVTVTQNAANLAANATTLTINGTGFDPVAANNSVALPGSGATNIQVTNATAGSLTVTFTGPLATGVLNAVVTSDGVPSASTQVATVTAASTPTVNQNSNVVATTTLTITGTGFDPSGVNTVVLTGAGGSPTATTGTINVVSATELNVVVTNWNNISGVVNAVVTVDGVSSGPPVQVATAESVGPPLIILPAGPTPSLAANATGLVLYGNYFTPTPTTVVLNGSLPGYAVTVDLTGFTAPVVSANQIAISGLTIPTNIPGIVFSAGAGYQSQSPPTIAFSGGGAATQATAAAVIQGGALVGITITNLGSGYTSAPTVTITGGSPTTAATVTSVTLVPTIANLTATVSNANGSNNGQLVATLTTTQTAPTITAATTVNPYPTLTITGTGFDPAGNNVITLYTDAAGNNPLPGAIAPRAAGSGQQQTATSTTIMAALAGPLPLGPIYAKVTAFGVPMTTPVQVANVEAPFVTTMTTNLTAGVPSVVIQGGGFNPTNDAQNVVTLYSSSNPDDLLPGAVASVVVNSANQLTVVFNGAAPPPAGQLWASVAVNGVTSGAPVQIANLVANGPTIAFDSGVLPPNPTTVIINGANFDAGGGNTVVLATQAGPVANVVAGVAPSATQLVVTLGPNALPGGQIYATVTTSGVTSSQVQVATVVPTITANTQSVPGTTTTFTINGTGFDTNPGGSNFVALSSGTVSKLVVTSATQLTVTVTGPLKTGALTATVTTNGASSAATQIATIATTVVRGRSRTFSVIANGALVVPPATGLLQGFGSTVPAAAVTVRQVSAASPAGGVHIVQTNGAFTYTPPPDYRGNVTFTYTVSDGITETEPIAVTVRVVGFTKMRR